MINYRYPTESAAFWLTMLLVSIVILFTSAATFCLSGVFILVMIAFAYMQNQSHHRALTNEAMPVNSQNSPELHSLLEECSSRLKPGHYDCFIIPSHDLNAYTFGIQNPKIVVLYSSLFKVMDRDELAFIIGHEMGHISLGHTWLNTILGGMAGVPTSYGAAIVLTIAFRIWNRICEYSADRAGLLACQNPEKAITALLKLISGDRHLTEEEIQHWLRVVDQEDDTMMGQFSEMLQDHPLIIKRINQIREYARSNQYRAYISTTRS